MICSNIINYYGENKQNHTSMFTPKQNSQLVSQVHRVKSSFSCTDLWLSSTPLCPPLTHHQVKHIHLETHSN